MSKGLSVFEVGPGDYVRLETDPVNAPEVYEEIKEILNLGPGKRFPSPISLARVVTVEGKNLPVIGVRSYHRAADMDPFTLCKAAESRTG